MQIIDNIVVFGDTDEPTLAQMRRVRDTGPVAGTALMADNHKGYSQPIGGVVAYRDAVSPSGVGYDISCGIMAVKTDVMAAELTNRAGLADDIARTVAFGMGRTSGANVDHPLFNDPLWPELERQHPGIRQLARQQLGTVGSGNHFVDILADEDGQLWVMAHFGSRGFGHKTASGFLNLAAGRAFDDRAPGESMDQPPTLLSLHSDVGQFYWEAMTLAGQYAYAGREYVVGQVLRLLGAQALDTVHNHHNFAWKEQHGGETVAVVRKGATPAFPDQRGAIGGSMGDVSVIVRGVDSPESERALYSTVHGAGRVMSRTAAAGKVKWTRDPKTGKKGPVRVSEGAVSQEMMDAWLQREGVVLRGGGRDESPHVYRRLPEVLAAHAGTIVIEQVLRPLIVVMAGADVNDPYKD